ncbi:MAG: 50S ribosomal protein L29 [Gammaproteobacteria bacterium]|jgi:large subunit ribosomal protein L29
MRELLIKWRSLDVVKLQEELQELIKQQFKLKMQHAIGELKEVHLLKNIRRNIAKILCVLTEKGATKG